MDFETMTMEDLEKLPGFTKTSLADVEAGDWVAIQGSRGSIEPRVITRTTKTQVIIGKGYETKFRRSDGKEVGSERYRADRALALSMPWYGDTAAAKVMQHAEYRRRRRAQYEARVAAEALAAAISSNHVTRSGFERTTAVLGALTAAVKGFGGEDFVTQDWATSERRFDGAEITAVMMGDDYVMDVDEAFGIVTDLIRLQGFEHA